MAWHDGCRWCLSHLCQRPLVQITRQLVRASLFLVGLIILVQIVNIHFHYMGEYLENGPGGFSGFFISPWENGFRMPVLGAWQKALYESAMPRALSATLYSIIYFSCLYRWG